MKNEIENEFSELNRRVKRTSNARYNASRRLRLNHQFSQWTLALLSVSLILIALISASDIKIEFSESYVDIMQIIFSVLVLAYSLLLATGDFSARSVKMHRCGMELGRLARSIKPYEEKTLDEIKYGEFYSKYYDILEKYENHEDVDFIKTTFISTDWYSRLKTEDLKFIPKVKANADDFSEKIKMWLTLRVKSIIPITHYILSVGLVYGWLFCMVSKGA